MTEKTKIYNSVGAGLHIRKCYETERRPEIEQISGPVIHLDNCILYEYAGEDSKINLFDIHSIRVDGITHRTATADNPYICDVLYDITFRNSVIYGAVFKYVHFHGSVSFDNCEIHTCSFFKVKADKGVYFNNAKIFNNIDFEQCVFLDKFSLYKCTVNATHPYIGNCEFYGECYLSYLTVKKLKLENERIKHDFQINECLFKNGLSLRKSVIDMNLIIAGRSVHNLELSEMSGPGLIEINSLTLTGANIIHYQKKEHYVKEIKFYNVILNGDLYIDKCCLDGFNITYSKIRDGNILHISNSRFDIFECISSFICGRIDLSDCLINQSFRLDETSVNGDFILLGSNSIPQIKDRYTAMLLKKESQKTANIPDFLKFRSIEMNLLYREMWKKPFKNSSDLFALTFNKLSNNFGISWTYGLVFTFISSILLFHLINYIGAEEPMFAYGSFDGYQVVIDKYLDVFNVFSIINIRHGDLNLNIWGTILLYITKIIISYGIFQTGMAFRKYNRK